LKGVRQKIKLKGGTDMGGEGIWVAAAAAAKMDFGQEEEESTE
jgi:hypothetical protein